jgi:putative monooxygenase
MGLAIMQPGERISEHYHPYSEEFVYVVHGELEVDLDDVTQPIRADQGLMIPIGMRHRFRNVGDAEARMVFHLGPLAPKPSMGHVDTEALAGNASGETYPAVQGDGAQPERRGVPS